MFVEELIKQAMSVQFHVVYRFQGLRVNKWSVS